MLNKEEKETNEIIIEKKIKENIEIKNEKNIKEDISEEQKQKIVEKVINKWLNLQKTIKEEITLEDVILKQQKDDTKNLKSFFVKYYQTKLNTRKFGNDIKQLKLDYKDSDILSYIINEELGQSFHDASEPIKNLLFILRNNYDYLTRIISLIKAEDFSNNLESINSLIELLNNNFYENILIPNPEQQELLILIYKLLEEEISKMSGANVENFLNDNTFIGSFLSSFTKKQEILGYFSMILNPLILSIDEDDTKDCFDLSINSIMKYIDIALRERRRSSAKSLNMDLKRINSDTNIKEYLFDNIPKTNIKFKNSFELEAEKEKEDELKYALNEDDFNDSDKNLILTNKKRLTISQKTKIMLGNKENEYNKEYKYDLNQNRLIEKISKEKDPEMKHVYIKLLEQINYYPNKYTNEGLLKILKNECEKKSCLLENYKENFIYIRSTVEELIQSIVDKIITLPYPIRCICKIINVLISKKFRTLSKYEVNSFVGKFFLNKCIFPILGLENKTFIDPRIYSQKTKNCLDTIISILSKANISSLFDTYSDPEKTIINQFLIEIIPIMNKFYEKIIDIQLPKVIDDLIVQTIKKYDELPSKKIFGFRQRRIIKKEISSTEDISNNNEINNQTPISLYEYFNENPDEILHLQSICFSANDINFLIDLIGRNINLFKDLPRFNFFSKTYTKVKNEEDILNDLSKEDISTKKKTFYVIFKDEKISILENLIKKEKKADSNFESGEQDSELICKRIKFCIKTILKGLNLLNKKDFAYLNFAQSTDKFFSALKYTLEELGEYNELSNDIPLKWYSQYIYNYKKELKEEYQEEDFDKLYTEISNEETNILDELKNLSNIVITRDGMNIRCAEKILERAIYEFRRIEEAKKYNQLEKFINLEKIEVCLIQNDDNKNQNTDKDISVNITDLKSCPNPNTINEKNHIHLNDIQDFIKLFSANNKIRLKSCITQAIIMGEMKFKISEFIGNYMQIVSKKIRENKEIFGELKERDITEFSKKIENHIIRQIYKYVCPPKRSELDRKIQMETKSLEWIQPENMEIKKLYVNQLKFAEKYISRINDTKSVFDKLDCIQNAYVILNNTVKFISGKNENAGQDELTPLFQYILIKSQPERLSSNINYIKCFLSEGDMMGENGFYCSQMESACTFILNIKSSDLKMNENEFNKKRELYRKAYEDKEKLIQINKNLKIK